MPKTLCVIRYNRPVVYTFIFVRNYLSHFSWRFLFSSGSGLAQYGFPGRGQLYYWELPFLVLGLIYWVRMSFEKSPMRKQFIVLSSWILIAPLANSLTGSAHPVRAILMLPIFQIFTAVGVTFSLTLFWKRTYFKYLYSILLSLVVLVSFWSFLVNYFLYYPLISDWNWQMGYKEVYRKLALFEENYEKIYISKFYGEPHIFYLFYRKFDPKKYQGDENVIRYNREDRWVNVDQIGKYYFVQEPGQIFLGEKDLMVVPVSEISLNSKIEGQISYRDGRTAFLILGK